MGWRVLAAKLAVAESGTVVRNKAGMSFRINEAMPQVRVGLYGVTTRAHEIIVQPGGSRLGSKVQRR